MFIKLAQYPKRRKKLNVSSQNGRLYQVLIENDAEFHPSHYNNFFQSLYEVYHPKMPFDWFSFEFHASRKGIGTYTWVSGGISKEFLASNINAIHSYAEIKDIEKKQDYANLKRFYGKCVSCATLELEQHYLFNLMHSDKGKVSVDFMNALASSLQNLDEDEEVLVQFLLKPVEFRKFSIAENYYDIYKKTGARPPKLRGNLAKITPYMEYPQAFLNALRHTFIGKGGKEIVFQDENLSGLKKKLESSVLFDIQIRLLTVSTVPLKAQERLKIVLSSFSPATDKNRLRANFKLKRETFLKEIEERRVSTYSLDNLLSPTELTYLLHYPKGDIPGFIRLQSKRLPVPAGILQFDSVKEAWEKGAYVFGKTTYRGRLKYLAFQDIKMLLQHLYTIGATGSGKTNMLLTVLLQVAQKYGICLTDVKDGESIKTFLEYLPPSEYNRVVLVDLSDEDLFVPFNLLKQEGVDTYDLATLITDIFKKTFSEGSIKEHSADILSKAVTAVIAADENATIMEISRIMTDENYLDFVLENLEKTSDFIDVFQYWMMYKNMKPKERMSETKAIRNKLAVFLRNKKPRFTTCQRTNILSNLRQLMDQKRIILLNMPIGLMTDEVLTFFSSLFMALLGRATFSRANIRENERVPFLAVLDEFERFLQQEEELRKFLEMARSLGLSLLITHQSTDQIPSSFLGLVRDNTFTQISLNLGPDSAKEVKTMFPNVSQQDLIGLEKRQGYALLKLLSPQPFTFETIFVGDMFTSYGEKQAEEFMKNYKKDHYFHINKIKREINNRYLMIKDVEIREGAEIKKGNASGKVRRVM